ncbi:hypothetical protein R1flu_027128 [Riccia fluitans]|uniref:Uncharacterized protein n=1 Tax=Riccia fluitans TaxID=41844 RepID=A0ABD1XHX4_9MARC
MWRFKPPLSLRDSYDPLLTSTVCLPIQFVVEEIREVEENRSLQRAVVFSAVCSVVFCAEFDRDGENAQSLRVDLDSCHNCSNSNITNSTGVHRLLFHRSINEASTASHDGKSDRSADVVQGVLSCGGGCSSGTS